MPTNEPLDPSAWGEYATKGRAHFDRVARSLDIFRRNVNDLYVLLRNVESDAQSSLRLMHAGGTDDEESEQFRKEFTGLLDQRLQNMISSAISLVDHTRPLISFYPHEREFIAEWKRRSDSVTEMRETAFIRRFRNYLLHVGVAPTSVTWEFVQHVGEKFTIKMPTDKLLEFEDWTVPSREYIQSCGAGVPILNVVEVYAREMRRIYTWLLEQYPLLHPPGVPPLHLYPEHGDS